MHRQQCRCSSALAGTNLVFAGTNRYAELRGHYTETIRPQLQPLREKVPREGRRQRRVQGCWRVGTSVAQGRASAGSGEKRVAHE